MASLAISQKNKRAIEKSKKTKKKSESLDPSAPNSEEALKDQEWLATTQGNTAVRKIQEKIAEDTKTPTTTIQQGQTTTPATSTAQLVQNYELQRQQAASQQAINEQNVKNIAAVQPQKTELNPVETPGLMTGNGPISNVISGYGGAAQSIFQDPKSFNANLALGALVEGLPGLGKLGSLVGVTPMGRANDIVKLMTDEASLVDSSNMVSMITGGQITLSMAKARVQNTESTINQLERKLQLTLLASPDARANPEKVDKMEVEILKLRQAIQTTKISLARLG